MYQIVNNNSNLFIFIFATAIIIKKFYMIANYDNNEMMLNLINKLNDRERELYKKIKIERFQIYTQGSFLGLVLMNMFLMLNRKSENPNINVCIAIIIWTMTTYLYYTLSKKSDYMIKYLDTQEEREAWLEIYKTMKNNCHGGFVLGIIVATLISIMFKYSL